MNNQEVPPKDLNYYIAEFKKIRKNDLEDLEKRGERMVEEMRANGTSREDIKNFCDAIAEDIDARANRVNEAANKEEEKLDVKKQKLDALGENKNHVEPAEEVTHDAATSAAILDYKHRMETLKGRSSAEQTEEEKKKEIEDARAFRDNLPEEIKKRKLEIDELETKGQEKVTELIAAGEIAGAEELAEKNKQEIRRLHNENNNKVNEFDEKFLGYVKGHDKEFMDKKKSVIEKVDTTRDAYLKGREEYIKNRSALRKISAFFGINEQYNNPAYKKVEALREAYDQARHKYGKNLYKNKKEVLEILGFDKEAIKKEARAYRADTIFQKIHVDEMEKLNKERAVKIAHEQKVTLLKTLAVIGTPAVLVLKGLSWMGKQGPRLFRIKTGKNAKGEQQYYEYKLGSAGRSLLFATVLATPIGIPSLIGSIARGVGGAAVAGTATEAMRVRHEKKILALENERDALRGQYSKGDIKIHEYEKKLADIEKKIKSTKDRQLAARAAVGLALGYGTAIGIGALEHGAAGVQNVHVNVNNHLHPAPHGPEVPPAAPHLPPVTQESIITHAGGHNGITQVFQAQLEHNPALAHQLGYDQLTSHADKVHFLANLGHKLGYINDHGGEVRVGMPTGMGAAYVLNVDAHGMPFCQEYEFTNGHFIPQDVGMHTVGAPFEGPAAEEPYEYNVDHPSYVQNADGSHVTAHHGGLSENPAHMQHIEPKQPAQEISNKKIENNNPESSIVDTGTGQVDSYVPTTAELALGKTSILDSIFGKQFLGLGHGANTEAWQEMRDMKLSEVLAHVKDQPTSAMRNAAEQLRELRSSFPNTNPDQTVENYIDNVNKIKLIINNPNKIAA